MDQIVNKGKKTSLVDSGLVADKRSLEIVCKVCGRKITRGEWVTKNVLTDELICEDCGEGVTGESFFSIEE